MNKVEKTNKATCPTCKRELNDSDSNYFPFCTERCREADLGAWFSEDYIVPGTFNDQEATERELNRIEKEAV